MGICHAANERIEEGDAIIDGSKVLADGLQESPDVALKPCTHLNEEHLAFVGCHPQTTSTFNPITPSPGLLEYCQALHSSQSTHVHEAKQEG